MAPKSLVRSDRHNNNNSRPLSITIMFLLHSSFIHSSIAFAYPPKKYKYFRHSLFIVFTGTLAYYFHRSTLLPTGETAVLYISRANYGGLAIPETNCEKGGSTQPPSSKWWWCPAASHMLYVCTSPVTVTMIRINTTQAKHIKGM